MENKVIKNVLNYIALLKDNILRIIAIIEKRGFMNKYEIEIKILTEFADFIPSVGDIPFNKALPKIRKELWRLDDKYDTDGDNVLNIIIKRYEELNGVK